MTSRSAKRMVQAAFDQSPLPDITRPTEENPQSQYTLMQGDYQRQIRSRLGASDLAQRLAYGLDMLPDIYEQMPWLLRSIELMRRPRTMEQLVDHVTRYLDWYLESADSHSLREAGSRTQLRFVLSSVGISVVLLLRLFFITPLNGDITMSIIFPLVLIPIVLLVAFTAGRDPTSASSGLSRSAINAAEFYFYIKDALADAEEPEAEKDKALASSAKRRLY